MPGAGRELALVKRAEKVRTILRRLGDCFPAPLPALHHSTPLELLVATMLSAQATDDHVNKVTADLFRKYRSVEEYAFADLEELRDDIRSVNFYRTKARNIQGSAQRIRDRFHGRIPETMAELVSLPGVARKTANIVLWNAFGINEGIAVDTHVKRLAKRLGLSTNNDPVKIEQDLTEITPRDQWGNISHYLILHGRTVCQARKPAHDRCVLYDICPSRSL